MDDLTRKSIIDSKPWGDKYIEWLWKEFNEFNKLIQTGQYSWQHYGYSGSCPQYLSYANFIAGENWRKCELFWQLYIYFDDFVNRKIRFRLNWNHRQCAADEFSNEFLNQLLAKAISPATLGCKFSTHSPFLQYEVPYAGHSFANTAFEFTKGLIRFNPAINQTLEELKKKRLVIF
jgi:hypothetical protein